VLIFFALIFYTMDDSGFMDSVCKVQKPGIRNLHHHHQQQQQQHLNHEYNQILTSSSPPTPPLPPSTSFYQQPKATGKRHSPQNMRR
jgi:hypothetical protein